MPVKVYFGCAPPWAQVPWIPSPETQDRSQSHVRLAALESEQLQMNVTDALARNMQRGEGRVTKLGELYVVEPANRLSSGTRIPHSRNSRNAPTAITSFTHMSPVG
jgi:hypothetical protein